MNHWRLQRFELYFVAAILAFCAMAYEISLVKVITSIIGDPVLAQALTLGVYLAASGTGAWLQSRFASFNAIRVFLVVEVLLSIIGALSVAAFLGWVTIYDLFFATTLQRYLPSLSRTAVLLLSVQVPVSIIGLLIGFEVPLLIALWQRSSDRHADAWVLSANYFGSLASCLIVPLILIPLLDTTFAVTLVAFMNLAVAYFVFVRTGFGGWTSWATAVLLVPLFLSWGVIREEPWLRDKFLKSQYMELLVADLSWTGIQNTKKLLAVKKPIERIVSPYQNIDFVESTRYFQDGRDDGYALYLDQRLQWTTFSEKIYHEPMVHGAVDLLGKVPQRVLILGGGDGFLARELLRYGAAAPTISLIELDEKIIELARKDPRMTNLNKHSLDDPRVHVVIGDAFERLRAMQEKYDLILIDFPFPNSYDLSKLFSVEFYRRVRAVLAPRGLVVLDFPLGVSVETWGRQISNVRPTRADVIYSTLTAAGFKTIFPFGFIEHFVVVSDEVRELAFDFDKLAINPLISNQSFVNFRAVSAALTSLEVRTEYVNSVFRPQALGSPEQ